MSIPECDMWVNTLIFHAESVLYKNKDVIIVGKADEYEACLDERIRFLEPEAAFKAWKKRNKFLSRIISYLGFYDGSQALDINILFLSPSDKKLKFKCTEKSLLMYCDKTHINKVIARLNENKTNGISGYEKFLEVMGKAAFGGGECNDECEQQD